MTSTLASSSPTVVARCIYQRSQHAHVSRALPAGCHRTELGTWEETSQRGFQAPSGLLWALNCAYDLPRKLPNRLQDPLLGSICCRCEERT